MNYLAHFLLSGNHQDVILGNYMGDSIKGSDFNNYSKHIAIGIKLHRLIDSTTDSHPIVKKHNSLIAPVFGKYSGIVTDVYYDYILANKWANYHHEPLKTYSHKMLALIESRKAELPVRAARFLSYMQKNDIPFNYHNINTIERVFEELAYRIGRESPLHLAPQAVIEHHEILEADFDLLWQDLLATTTQYLHHANL